MIEVGGERLVLRDWQEPDPSPWAAMNADGEHQVSDMPQTWLHNVLVIHRSLLVSGGVPVSGRSNLGLWSLPDLHRGRPHRAL